MIQAYVNNHPPDEVVPVTQGRDLGWPYCNPNPDLATPAGSEADVPFTPDAVTNPGGTTFDCATLGSRSKSACPPTARRSDWISWRAARSPPRGRTGRWSPSTAPGTASHPRRPPSYGWLGTPRPETLTPAVTLVAGFQESDGSRWGRPVDAVPGPDGSLYVSDDTAGAIYRLTPPTS